MTTTLIAKRTRVGGRIDTEGDVLVEGRVEGTLIAAGTVTVGVTGVAVCDVEAGRVIVLGIIIGNISATERVDVAASARVVGDVKAPAVALAASGLVEGKVEETGAAPPAPPTTPAPEAVAVAGVVSGAPVQRPTLRIRGTAMVRPARPEAAGPEPTGPAPQRSTAELGAVPRLRTRDPSVIPLPPRPPSRVRMNPRRSTSE